MGLDVRRREVLRPPGDGHGGSTVDDLAQKLLKRNSYGD